jgi:hypothetical protein
MRASFDPEDAQNVEEIRINTPRNIYFQSSIEVELTVREDGTAEPRFIYGPSGKARVDARPFWMDMTFATDEVEGESYLGFDFGTSTSACSFIHTRDIQLIEKDSQSSGWKDLSDLVV